MEKRSKKGKYALSVKRGELIETKTFRIIAIIVFIAIAVFSQTITILSYDNIPNYIQPIPTLTPSQTLAPTQRPPAIEITPTPVPTPNIITQTMSVFYTEISKIPDEAVTEITLSISVKKQSSSDITLNYNNFALTIYKPAKSFMSSTDPANQQEVAKYYTSTVGSKTITANDQSTIFTLTFRFATMYPDSDVISGYRAYSSYQLGYTSTLPVSIVWVK